MLAFRPAKVQRSEKHFGVDGPAWSADNIHRHLNKPLHSVAEIVASLEQGNDSAAMPAAYAWRVKMEQSILNSHSHEEIERKIDAWPKVWAGYMRDITGLKSTFKAKDFALDESHMLTGMIGYFPAYPESAKNVAAIMAANKDKLATTPDQPARTLGDLIKPHYELIRDTVMRPAAGVKPDEIMTLAAGSVPTMSGFLQSLQDRFSGTPAAAPRGPAPAPRPAI